MNLFPCNVRLSDGTVHELCRVVTDTKGTVVWKWDGQQPAVVAETDAFPEDSGNNRFRLLGEEGNVSPDGDAETIHILYKPGECGCGHPLKSYTPARRDGGPVRATATSWGWT